MNHSDTIFALSTPSGQSAVAVIRITGPKCMYILLNFFGFKPKKTRHAYFKSFKGATGKIIDECLVIFFEGPNSFTGDDVIEIQSHGSISIINSIFDEFRKISGLRMAKPGEFSLRAFYNNKQSVLYYEGVNNLIRAETEKQRRIANNQTFGFSENLCKRWENTILELLAHVDAIIEFSEEEDINSLGLETKLKEMQSQIQSVLLNSRIASQIMNGIKILIFGPPNAGKSSLFNLLCGHERAIVSDLEGTTRDQISAHINILNNKAVLTDSAGIRTSKNKVEKIGVEKTLSAVEGSTKLILVLSPDCLTDANKKVLRRNISVLKNKKIVVVYNKTDLDPTSKKYSVWTQEIPEIAQLKYISISCLACTKEDAGKRNLVNFLVNNLINVDTLDNDDYFFSEERHIDCMHNMLKEINKSIANFDNIEICAENLRNALKFTNELYGNTSNEKQLEYIFNNFCIGK